MVSKTGKIVKRRYASKGQLDQLFSKARVFVQRSPILATLLTEKVRVKQGDGSIVTAHPGDYLIRNLNGNTDGVWRLRWDYFEQNFRKSQLLTNIRLTLLHVNRNADELRNTLTTQRINQLAQSTQMSGD